MAMIWQALVTFTVLCNSIAVLLGMLALRNLTNAINNLIYVVGYGSENDREL